MRMADANIPIHAYSPESPSHLAAKAWFEAQISSGSRFALPWPVILAYVRICSNPRATRTPVSIEGAWRTVESWLAVPGVWIPAAGARHPEVLAGLLRVGGLNSNDVMDAHLAALAIEHGLVLCSTDTGFKRFPGLRYENPLETAPPKVH